MAMSPKKVGTYTSVERWVHFQPFVKFLAGNVPKKLGGETWILFCDSTTDVLRHPP